MASLPVSPGANPPSQSPAKAQRAIRKNKSAFLHGNQSERAAAAAALAALAANGSADCHTLLHELGPQFVAVLSERAGGGADEPTRRSAEDEQTTTSILLTLRHMSAYLPDKVCALGVLAPLVTLCADEEAPPRRAAAECIAVLCEDEDARATLVHMGAAPVLARLSVRERSARADETALVAANVVLAMASDFQLRRAVAGAAIHTELLVLVAPQLPDAGDAAIDTQLAALRGLYILASSSEFKAALGAEASFFPMLFQLRDSSVEAVTEGAHLLASIWADDFVGWAWECCAGCKQVHVRMCTGMCTHLQAGLGSAVPGASRYTCACAQACAHTCKLGLGVLRRVQAGTRAHAHVYRSPRS